MVSKKRNKKTGEWGKWNCVAVTGKGEAVTAEWRAAIIRHLLGHERLAVFPIATAPQVFGKVRFSVIDLDGTDRLNDALRILEKFSGHGLTAYLEPSWTEGSFHVWVFWWVYERAGRVRDFLLGLLADLSIDGEVRPSSENSREWRFRPDRVVSASPFLGLWREMPRPLIAARSLTPNPCAPYRWQTSFHTCSETLHHHAYGNPRAASDVTPPAAPSRTFFRPGPASERRRFTRPRTARSREAAPRVRYPWRGLWYGGGSRTRQS